MTPAVGKQIALAKAVTPTMVTPQRHLPPETKPHPRRRWGKYKSGKALLKGVRP